MNGRRIGLVLALVVGCLALGLVAWSAVQGARARNAAAGPTTPIGPTPNLTPESGQGRPSKIEDLVAGAGETRLVGFDKADPKRVEYELFYATLDPQPSGRFQVTQPRAWLYPKGGGLVHIQAGAMNYVMPAGSRQPESGRFTGGVLIRVFDAAAAKALARGGGAPEGGELPATAPEAQGSLATETMTFDAVIGEIATADSVNLGFDGLLVRCVGLRVVVDETRQRLSFLRTERDGTMTYTPVARAGGAKDAGGESAARRKTGPGGEDLYRAEFSGDVRLTSGSRTIAADTLETWARFVGGSLPANAIAGPTKAGTAVADDTTRRAGAAGSAGPAAVTLTWSGPLTVRPLESAPPELKDGHLTARFTAPVRGVVALTDTTSGLTGRCVGLDYRFTSGAVTLTGPGDRGVTLTAPGVGEVLCGRVDLNLVTGLGAAPGPGVLRALAPARPIDPFEASPVREIVWQERSDLVFATRDGFVDTSSKAPLREATFRGAVVARRGAMRLSGDFLRAVFEESPTGETSLRRVIVEGDAAADGGAEGTVKADRLDAAFEQAPGAGSGEAALVPTMVTAQGRVRGQREGATLAADMVEAHIDRTAGGSLRVARFKAELGVVINARGAEVSADSVRVTAPEGRSRIVELTGAPVTLRRGVASLTGGAMRYDEDARALTVFGAGVFNHSQPRQNGMGYERLQLQWQRSMTFNDTTGAAEFTGDCEATAQPNELTRDIANADRIVLALTPRDAAVAPDAATTPAPGGDDASRLLRVSLFGASAEAPAKVQSRRYAADAGSESGLRLERVAYLDGLTIVVDREEDALHVPCPGRLLLEDRRDDGDANASPVARGTTLFEWDNRLDANRRTGEATMQGRVRMRQRPLNGDTLVELECERLSAQTTPGIGGDGPSAGPASQPEVLRAEAQGAVYARRGQRELIGDRLLYDGVAQSVQVFASPGNLVTLFDRAFATPLTGESLRWDLVRDRVEWKGAGETTAPR